MPPAFTFNNEVFQRFVSNRNGGIAKELRRQGQELVNETKTHLSTPRPPRVKGKVPKNTTRIPWEDTGDLRRSVRLAELFDARTRSISYGIVAGSVHDGIQYAAELMERNFILAPPRVNRNL